MKRRRDGGQGTDRPSFGHAAFDPADIEDARRGHPALSLQPFAEMAGLDYRGSEQAGAFLSTLPTWPDYIFNGCRGQTPSGRLGMLDHELFEVEAHNGSVQAAGSFYDVRVTTRNSLVELSGLAVGAPKNEPFAGNAVWIPTTTVHVRAPETNRLPVLRITRSSSFSVSGNNGLDHLGLPGFRVLRGDENPEALAAVVAACGPWLSTRPDAHVSLRIRYGLVAVTVNGYRTDPSDLSHLWATADGIAAAAAATTPPLAGHAFDSLGPPVGSVRLPPGVPLPHPLLVPAYAQLATQWGYHNEDVSHLLLSLPRCPIPGIASGVLAGNLPGSNVPARIVWFEQGGRTSGSVRGGVIVPARSGAATPLGGVLDERTGMYLEIVDGVAYCWRKQRTFGELQPNELLQAAITCLSAKGEYLLPS